MLCLGTQLCPTLCDPMDCSPPGSSVHGDSPGRNTGVGSLSLLQGIFPTQGSNPGLPHWRQILHCLSLQESPRILQWVVYPFCRGSSQPRSPTRVSCIAGGFCTSWASREAHNVDWFLPYNVNQPLSIHMWPPSCSSLPPHPTPPVVTECWVGPPVLCSSSPLAVWWCVCQGCCLSSSLPFLALRCPLCLHLYSCPANRFIEIFHLKDGYLRSRKWFKNYKCIGLLWWLSGKESTYQCRRHRFDPSSGKILHAVEQLSPCHSYWVCALEPGSHDYWAQEFS